MKKLFVLLMLAIVLGGCSLLKFPALNAPPPPDTTYQYNETFKKNPVAVAVDGKIVVVENQERTVNAGYVNKEKPLSFWQRFCNWLAGWSLITVVTVGGCLAFGITGPALWLYQRFLVLRKTTKQMVRAIAEAKAVETQPELKNKLSSMLDTDSKKLVDDIRRE